MPINERLLSLDGLAERWGVSTHTLRRLESRGEIPSVRVGGQIRFSPRAIEGLEEHGLRGVIQEAAKEYAAEVGLEIGFQAILQRLTIDEARAIFDRQHADELQQAKLVVGGNIRLARSVVVARLNREEGVNTLIRPRGPTRQGVLAAAERQRGPHSRRPKRPPA